MPEHIFVFWPRWFYFCLVAPRHGLDERDGLDGRDGRDGWDGQDGQDGRDGLDCWRCEIDSVVSKNAIYDIGAKIIFLQ